MCQKCSKTTGFLLLLVGVLFLLQDLRIWMFWGLNWYTVGFLLLGIGTFASASCAECQGCCGSCEEKPKKKK